jgi:hypothetical protein
MRRFTKLLIELETALWKARMPLTTWHHYAGNRTVRTSPAST